jgi:hypothetical protein
VQTFDTILASFVDGRSRPWAQSFDLIELDIRVFNCNSAMVVGLAEVRPIGLPADAAPLRLRFLNVWRRTDDGWVYAANQWTRATAAAANAR